MRKENLYATTTDKDSGQFARDFRRVAEENGFVIHNGENMYMPDSFMRHGAAVAPGFDLYMMQICKPAKAAQSMGSNPERAILMPKFVMIFTANGKTQIRFLRYGEDDIRELVDDPDFPASLEQTYQKITEMIEQASQ